MGFTTFFELGGELTDGIHNLWVVCVCGSSVELGMRYQLHTATDVGLVGSVRFTRAIGTVTRCGPSEQNTSFSQAILITKLSHFFDDLFPRHFRTQ